MRQAAIVVFNAAVTLMRTKESLWGFFASDPQKFSQLDLVVNGNSEMWFSRVLLPVLSSRDCYPTSAQSLPAQPQRELRQDAAVTPHAFTSACVAVLTGPMAFEQAPLASRHTVCTAGSRKTQSACSRRAASAVALGLVPAELM
jgi:hypothetical protein